MVESPERTVAAKLLLETKLYIPRWNPDLVSRPRLIEQLERGIGRKLTLVSAPAGFGKSTLLAEWLTSTPADERRSAWVSLEPSDSDPSLFWAYFITALQKMMPGIGESTLAMLHSPKAPPIEVLLGTLLNEISAAAGDPSSGSGQDYVLVLDDYHAIDSEPVHAGVTFLLDHLPQKMHLIITGRTDPPLPLARLRGRGESTELRAPDLRFTPDETANFLSEVMGLEISSDHVVALESRTEGWIAGLQLAALSMQGRDDVAGFIDAFTGDDRYIVDYLVEEVLQRQPDRVRNFLLKTSVLDRLNGPLCDAITGQEDGKAMLETLERSNLFLVPLDGNRQWYRYHHLFGDVLHSRLEDEQSEQLPNLHRKAGDWYEQNGLPADVMRHALAGEDFERAATVMELEAMAMISRCEEPTLIDWFQTLPDAVIRARPVLSVYYAFIALSFDGLDAPEDFLGDAERLLDIPAGTNESTNAASPEMVVADENAFRNLPESIAVVRAFQAEARQDYPSALKHARQALKKLPESEYFWRGAATALLGMAYWGNGDLEAAHTAFIEGIATIRLTGDTDLEVSGESVLAGIRMGQGRLREAERILEQALRISADHGEPVYLGTPDLYVVLSLLHCEYGDLEAARVCLMKCEELGDIAAISENRYRFFAAKALISQIEGDLESALDLLSEAERKYVQSPTPNVRSVGASKARVWIQQGRLAEAMDWARSQGLYIDDDGDELTYIREYEHTTLAKVIIAQNKSGQGAENSLVEVTGLLERLLDSAEQADRTGSIIQILIMQALAYEAQNDIPAGLKSLERALILAEPEGYVRTFVDEGESMRGLLRHAVAEDISSPYSRRLLSAFDGPALLNAASAPTNDGVLFIAGLVEQLSEREIEVLSLVASGATNQQIADQLVVSLSTVKTHINRTYRKLDVHSRTQAVAKIRQLGIV